jgi:hypothetical protein
MISAAVLAGCTKKIKVTIRNHTTSDKTVQLTVPDGTRTIGVVGKNSGMTHTLAVKKDDLPAQCHYAAGAGASVSFEVSDDSPDIWFFHITNDGKLAGPYGKNDVHTETENRGKVELRTGTQMIVE